MNCGIIGLPNVGKSTIFSALSSAPAEAANYPFCTIDPNVGVVEVPDERLDRIDSMIEADRKMNTVTEFVDIAGLVRGASKGLGLGNQFLANIREVGIIAHVVRCFQDDDVVHVEGGVEPLRDIETVNVELALADLQMVEKRLEKNARLIKASDARVRVEAKVLEGLLQNAAAWLSDGRPIRSMDLENGQRVLLHDLLSLKSQLYVCNIGEKQIGSFLEHVEAVKSLAAEESAEVIVLCGKLEADIASIREPQERKLFLTESGLERSGLEQLISSSYATLGLKTFFTCGGMENRAWTFKDGCLAPECAGIIHSDFERGFIKADVYNCEDLFKYGSESAVKSAGKLRTEGRAYKVLDGDIMHFKFNV